MSAELLARLERYLPAGILAAADLREQRAKAATPGPWAARHLGGSASVDQAHGDHLIADVERCVEHPDRAHPDAEHIAAEANPAHALAAVRRWRAVVERHKPFSAHEDSACTEHLQRVRWRDCPDLTETADEVRAYLGGAA